MTNSTRAVAALLEIMANKKATLRRRIEAAEAVLGYEAPEDVVERTKRFLVKVFEDTGNVGVDDRLEALKLMRKAEARKITPQSTASRSSDKDRELWRDIEIAARRMKLDKAGLWGKHGRDWCDDLLRDDYISPPADTAIADLFEE